MLLNFNYVSTLSDKNKNNIKSLEPAMRSFEPAVSNFRRKLFNVPLFQLFFGLLENTFINLAAKNIIPNFCHNFIFKS